MTQIHECHPHAQMGIAEENVAASRVTATPGSSRRIIVNCYYGGIPFVCEEIPFHGRTWRDDFYHRALFANLASRRVYPGHADGIWEARKVLRAKRADTDRAGWSFVPYTGRTMTQSANGRTRRHRRRYRSAKSDISYKRNLRFRNHPLYEFI